MSTVRVVADKNAGATPKVKRPPSTIRVISAGHAHLRRVRASRVKVGIKGVRTTLVRTLCGQLVNPPNVVRVDRAHQTSRAVCPLCSSLAGRELYNVAVGS